MMAVRFHLGASGASELGGCGDPGSRKPKAQQAPGFRV